ncbi:unnamed protein product [Chondrus crispus]|uniref:Lysosomal dipeptide transporter MFSD1 n=1 Tax=Chondrus crispus TaxID=2769 RepID=R7QRP5_CHOCR|nr:unnamed protein product [Chondrus crispus]CDF40819.1 unnamed protein product [Chondrus crispus]|eukprot:XP_005711113.1 unnamed protein product [Chondrus crispus]
MSARSPSLFPAPLPRPHPAILSSLGPEIMAALDLRRVEFGILFSSQELPGIVLPVAGGLALTYVPHAAAAVALSACVLISTALCAVALHNQSYAALFAGRFLFGLCDGALTTLQGALVAHWFRHRIGTSFGLTLLVSRLSSFTGLALPAFLSSRIGLRASMWFSVVMCLPGFLATIAYAVCVPRIAAPADLAYTPADDAQGARLLPPDDGPAADSVGPPRMLAVLRSLSPSFWLISYLWVAVAGAVFSMLHFAADAFSAHLGLSFVQSGLLSGSLVLFAGLASPAVGVAQDRFGRRSLLLGVSCGAIGLGILLCASGVSRESGRAAVASGLFLVATGLGIAPVTLLSSLALCVEDVATPAALGLYKGVENAALAVLHVVTGALRDASGEYTHSLPAISSKSILCRCSVFEKYIDILVEKQCVHYGTGGALLCSCTQGYSMIRRVE